MKSSHLRSAVLLGFLSTLLTLLAPNARAQQTLGGITGTVTDASGAVISGATVNLLGDETKLSRTQTTNANGSYLFVNLPIGNYTLSFTQQGFQSQNVPAILVQANRTATVNVELKVGNVSESITVEESPLINFVDTTNGYVMDKLQIEAVPLPTGSFTGLAILSPGVNAELSSGTGANAGLGNAPVWANGERDTSNTFMMNGVSAYSLFNGKSTSQVNSARVVNNTGIGTTAALSSVPIQSSSSVYLAIGESIPSPAPETISEVRVNTSMYDAQQGATSGAHIDMSTASGTNNIHGTAYVHAGTNLWNANPYFFNADPNIPASEKNPYLLRYTTGGAIGLPIKKDKIFFYGGYQHTHASDQEIGISRAYVPLGLGTGPPGGAACADRSAQCLAAIANAVSMAPSLLLPDPCVLPQVGTATTSGSTPCGFNGTSAQINPIAYALFNCRLFNGQCNSTQGPYLIPNASTNSVYGNPAAFSSNPVVQSALVEAFPEDAEVPGRAYFLTNQAVANLDWNPNSSHSLFAKYYYQHDPTIAPYAYSQVAGFAQHLDAGSQVVSLSHTQIVKSNLSITEIFGFIREKAYSTMDQPFSPQQLATFAASLPEVAAALTRTTSPISKDDLLIHNLSGSNIFPGIGMVYAGAVGPFPILPSYPYSLMIGSGSAGQGAFTGVFQNRFYPSANAIWTHGRHTISFGGSFAYTQMNTRDRRDQIGMIASEDFTQFLGGALIDNYSYNITATINGNANRYWRANETGEYIQDKFQWHSNLTITAGVRFDWNGGLTEKNGNLLNFDPSGYNYDPTTDTLKTDGLIIAGNNPKFATPGVSATTLTGRQWGLAPRVGVAWSPKIFNSKVVVRAGWGMYYDRGELYSYLSPGLTQNITNGGPFGINQQAPFVSTQFCPTSFPGPFNFCDPTQVPRGNQLAYPWGVPPGTQPTGNPTSVVPPTAPPSFCPGPGGAQIGPQNIGSYIACGAPPFYLGAYARNNKLPYSMNSTLDIQWQPRNDLAIDIGYVNGLGRHEVIPVPFNQARIASPTHPLCGQAGVCAGPNSSPLVGGYPLAQFYTYGYTVQTAAPGTATCPGTTFNPCPISLPNGPSGQALGPMLANSEGGNVDLRVPYIGYGAESEIYTAEGISAYNALQAHLEKRLSHGLQAGVSYTFSRSFDEQSALGLFYNGNNPLNIRDGYGPSDFDRTHIFSINYHYEFPKFFRPASWEGKVGNGWALQGVVILQSGQPYSVVDYSGAVGSVYYSIYDGITNPIVPLNFAAGCTPKNAVTGAKGATPGLPALKASCFTVPLLNPGDLGGAIPTGDTYETNFTSGQRNIFRQSWQKRADISLVKTTAITERFSLKYSFDVYNLTNHPSFDIPIDNVSQNLFFSQVPYKGTPAVPSPATCAASGNFVGSSYFYQCPTGLGQVVHTIGSARQIQMSLSLAF
jgi:carboxypeptidase family protein/TonB-dependent receptor-like protein